MKIIQLPYKNYKFRFLEKVLNLYEIDWEAFATHEIKDDKIFNIKLNRLGCKIEDVIVVRNEDESFPYFMMDVCAVIKMQIDEFDNFLDRAKKIVIFI
jgi:hypothetical protein